MSSVCKVCGGKGLPEGCTGCGTQSYAPSKPLPVATEIDFRIPSYYKTNIWESNRIVDAHNKMSAGILDLLDRLIRQVREGKAINASYAFLLPPFYGKKTAMFTIMQEYIAQGRTVSPAVDVVSLALMENNFSLNKKKAVADWEALMESDLVCVYGVDFSAKYQTIKLYSNLCEIRGLRGKPTLLFATNSVNDLRSRHLPDNLLMWGEEQINVCRLSNPYVLDGVKK